MMVYILPLNKAKGKQKKTPQNHDIYSDLFFSSISIEK